MYADSQRPQRLPQPNAVRPSFDGVPFRVIHLSDLIKEKQATGRLKDLADVEELEKLASQNLTKS